MFKLLGVIFSSLYNLVNSVSNITVGVDHLVNTFNSTAEALEVSVDGVVEELRIENKKKLADLKALANPTK